MDCRAAQAAISERLDGASFSPRKEAAVDRHLSGCDACTGFATGAWKLREAVRFEVASEVPDLVRPIMASVLLEGRPERERHLPRIGLPGRRRDPRPRRSGRLRRELAGLAAALMAGALAGVTVVGTGLWPGDRAPGPPATTRQQAPQVLAGTASPAEVGLVVARDATELRAYHTRYLVEERGFRPGLAVREFTLDLWFDAPERLRLEVIDHTSYPASWPRNDSLLVVDGDRWFASSPSSCPLEAFPSCPLQGGEVRNLKDRAPFAASAPLPTDAVLPLATLADGERLTVLGADMVGDRDAVRMELSFADAAPLFAFLRQGGTWRPFHPDDRVVLWLDAERSIPLRFEVSPAPGAERAAWAERHGLAPESPDGAILSATAIEVDTGPAPADRFAIPAGPAQSQGSFAVTFEQATQVTGIAPVLPADTAGLGLYRVVLPPAGPGQPGDQTVVTFTEGLAWLKVRQSHGWSGEALFGGIGARAERVTLPGGGVAYYEPAAEGRGRRLAVHGDGIDLALETNLSRAELLAVAASLPVRGRPAPAPWLNEASGEGSRERVSLATGQRRVGFQVDIPTLLPSGFRLLSTELVRVGRAGGLTLYFGSDEVPAARGIRLHVERATALPPASGAEQFAVQVRGLRGRWTPERSALEWIEDGLYRSLTAPGWSLEQVLDLAGSIGRPAR